MDIVVTDPVGDGGGDPETVKRLLLEVTALKALINKAGRTLSHQSFEDIMRIKFSVPLVHVTCACGLPMIDHLRLGDGHLSCTGFLVTESEGRLQVEHPSRK